MGNRTSHSFAQSVNGGAVSTTNIAATHNRLNQVTAQSSSVNGVALTGTNFVYDASGNMTAMAQSNGGSTYLYDDADRLVSITQKDTATGAFTKKSEYVYDGEDRKVISREYSWDATLNNNAGGWALTEEKRRVYDGMDVVQERDVNNVETVRYTRAGNIGGLLGRSDASGDYFYHYDGSGNVVGLTNASQQTVAEYSYDAWGNTLRATGAMANVNTYRYSTKEYQSASGLYDYGYRFYSPGLGRWINRDPIREAGGLNVYGFVDNDPVNTVDEDGLSPLRAVRDSLMRNGPAIGRGIGAAGRGVANYVGPRLNPSNYSLRNGVTNLTNAANRVGQLFGRNPKPCPPRRFHRGYRDALRPYDKKYSRVLREANKHPNVVGRMPQGLANQHRAAEDALKNIMRTGVKTTRDHNRYGRVTEYKLPNGVGARFNADETEFLGFLGRGK